MIAASQVQIARHDEPVSSADVPPAVAEPQASIVLSVVIPALNEEDGIAEIVRRVAGIEPELHEVGVQGLEIIVVDDGSRDRTAEIAESMEGVRVLRHSTNRGYGAALKSGFGQARGDLLGFLDADGTYPPERFPSLCAVALHQDADMVVGSRRSGANSQMPRLRRLGNFLWSNLVSLLGNQWVADPASGMRVVRRSALPQLYPLPDGLNFTPVMSTRAVHETLNVVELPIPYRERTGRSKLSVVRDGTRFLSTILWTDLEYNPVRLLGAFGLAALGVAGLVVLALLVARLQGVTQLGPWGVFGVFSALVVGVTGVSIFSLGAASNYLVTLFHRRPIRQGLFGRPIFDPPLEYQFGWVGGAAVLTGLGLAGGSLGLSLQGWEIERLWLWLVGSAMLILIGLQLVVSWIVMRVLQALSERDLRTREDLEGAWVDGPPGMAREGADR